MNASQTFFDLHFLGLRIVFESFNPAFLVLDVAAQVCVLFFQHSNLAPLFVESGKALWSSEHDGRVGGESHQSSKSCDGPENGW